MFKKAVVKMPETTNIPTDEMGKIFVKLRKALELKFKIMGIIYPKMFDTFDPRSHEDMRDLHADNYKKLKKLQEIKKLIEEFYI